MKILIVGGTRFIGKNLVSELVKTNVEFFLTSRRINPDVPHSQQIICDREEFNKSTGRKQKFDIIITNHFFDTDIEKIFHFKLNIYFTSKDKKFEE